MVLMLVGGVVALWPAVAVEQEVHVAGDPFRFSPLTRNVSAGDTIVWINDTAAAHTATSDDGSSFNIAIPPNGNSAPQSFTGATRDINYHCSIHPSMTGTVHVTAVIAPAPTTTTTARPIAAPTTRPATTTSRVTTSTSTPTTETIAEETTTTEESTTSTTGDIAINTDDGGSNGGAIALLIAGIVAVLGGGGYAIYRMRSGQF